MTEQKKYPETEIVGSLWQKNDKNGNVYFSGMFAGQRITVFKTREKKSDKSPDYTIQAEKGVFAQSQTSKSETPTSANEYQDLLEAFIDLRNRCKEKFGEHQRRIEVLEKQTLGGSMEDAMPKDIQNNEIPVIEEPKEPVTVGGVPLNF